MPLVFCLKAQPALSVDVAPLQLERLAPRNPAQVAAIPIWMGNRQVPCGEIFEIAGSAADSVLIFEGNCERLKSIGAGLRHGKIQVHGNAGMHLGAQMRGGEILVTGHAGDWAGAEMKGGRIQILGDTGHHAGAAYPGSKRGMTGGELLICGNAGDGVGLRQRRGLVAVGGHTGAATGAGMIAGTIVIGDQPGEQCGTGMKRGSILVLQPDAPFPLTMNFRLAAVGQPTFVRLYLRHLLSLQFPLPEISIQSHFRIYRGDSLTMGLGEIVCLTAVS